MNISTGRYRCRILTDVFIGREANDLNKFVKDLQLREKRAKQELRIYLDRLFRRIINTENQLR